MDFLTQQEIKGLKQDISHGAAKQVAEKSEFERKLLNGLGEEMTETLEHPDDKKKERFARKYTKKKRMTVWKENLKRIFGKS